MASKVKTAAALLAAKRWKGTTAEERQAVAAKGGTAAWSKLSAAERSEIMTKRAQVRKASR